MHKLLPHLALTCSLILFPSLETAIANTTPMENMVSSSVVEDALTREEAVVYLYEHFLPDILRKKEVIPELTFLDIPENSPLLPILGTLCKAEAISCTGGAFAPDQAVSFPALLKMYDVLLHYYTDAPLVQISPEKRSSPEWNSAYMQWGKDMGLTRGDALMTPVTHSDISSFIDKIAYLRSWNYALPTAYPRLPEGLSEINDTIYTTRADVDSRLGLLEESERKILERMMTLQSGLRQAKDALALSRLRMLRTGFSSLASFMDEHPLYYDGSFSEEERAEFRKLGIKEIVGVGEYDFRNNASYRKYNVRTTLKNVHKLVLQPEEEFDYWKVMDGAGLDEVGNGWLIVEGKEVWGWGGGLCGTSTTIFRAAWFAGLEILERRPHTTYYTGLYGRNDMGLDAAVYQNSPNLRFKNSTGAPIMLYLRYNDTEDYAQLFVLGTKDFDSFEFVKGAKRGKVVNHKRVIMRKDGTVQEDQLYSAYRTIE